MRTIASITLVLASLSQVARGDDPRVKWMKPEPAVKSYVFPRSVGDDVNLCVELPGKRIGCVTVEKIRAIARDGVPR